MTPRTGALAGLAAVVFAVTMWGLVPVAMRYLILGLSPESAARSTRLQRVGLKAAGEVSGMTVGWAGKMAALWHAARRKGICR